MKLRRNPTPPPPSLGGYEPLEYDDECKSGSGGEGGGEEELSSVAETRSQSQSQSTLRYLFLFDRLTVIVNLY